MHLLRHSDCEGKLEWPICEAIAIRLDEVVADVKRRDLHSTSTLGAEQADIDAFVETCERFAQGCRKAYAAQENVEFH